MNKKYYIANSAIQGKGLFAAKDFNLGDLILTVTGKTISKEEFQLEAANGNILLLEFDDGRGIDISQHDSKYINHSCSPNTQFVDSPDNSNVMLIQAIKMIQKEEELTFNYNWDWSKIEGGCKCGTCK